MVRGVLALGASLLAGIATVVSSLDEDPDFVPFFVSLTFFGGVQAWAGHAPSAGWRQRVARGVAIVWLIAALWAAVLLTFMQSMFVQASSGPTPLPQETYFGLTATAYHAIGLFGGAVLAVTSAFGPDGWFPGTDRPTGQ